MADIRTFAYLISAPLALCLGNAYAGEHHDHDHHDDHDHRAHDVHVHGTWELFAALDDARLSVTLKGPLIDVLGFETVPDTDEEYSAVVRLKDQLKSSESMFTLDGRARCELSEPVAIVLPEGFSTETARRADDKAHDHDDKKEHHAHESEDSHSDHDVRAADSAPDGRLGPATARRHWRKSPHSHDLEVTYTFNCASPDRLSEITMAGFETFPAIENVDAVFLGDALQIARRLESGSRIMQID